MKLVERFRGAVVDHALRMPSFEPDWHARRAFMRSQLGTATPTRRQLVESLGDHLSDAFRTVGAGRMQHDVTNAGAVWHCLVTYYLNLIYAGTNAVAVTASFGPRSVKAAMNVSYGGTSVKGDLDVALLVLPEADQLLELPRDTTEKRRARAKREYMRVFDDHFTSSFVCLIACKTNWNDLVQSPMLWNLLYSMRAAGGVMPPGMSIGTGGFSLDQLGPSRFANAFATVPSNGARDVPPRSKFTSVSMPVQRMRTMTGGYYWGYPQKPGVVDNIHELPDRLAAKSPVVPRAAEAGVAFARELSGATGAIDLDAFDWA